MACRRPGRAACDRLRDGCHRGGRSDPWNTAKALTWLSGSTYGRTAAQVVPVAIALLLLTPVVALARRDLDLLSLDDDTPRVLGVRLGRTRLVALAGAALLTSTAVSAIGVIGFVGLVAPHIARALVGGRHARMLPVAALVGAILVSLADTLGRTPIAPAQIPAGLVTAMVGDERPGWWAPAGPAPTRPPMRVVSCGYGRGRCCGRGRGSRRSARVSRRSLPSGG
ncbi:iron chelate uptake ABC transporter family permease subunit [Plantactinospora sp. CA-294935]|uniref:iron chelate uptake ABC transporter family permease subunit n=1 Tax=Plantactinospora sp. CA-294935 TaxID=3240012 RepID=UPI003D8EEF86